MQFGNRLAIGADIDQHFAKLEMKHEVGGIFFDALFGLAQLRLSAEPAVFGEVRFVFCNCRIVRVRFDKIFVGLDVVVVEFHLQIGRFADECGVGILRERRSVGEPLDGGREIVFLLEEASHFTNDVNVRRIFVVTNGQFRKLIFDHVLGSHDAILLLQRSGEVLVFDQVAIIFFAAGFGDGFPTTALHRGGSGGVLAKFHRGDVVFVDLDEFVVDVYGLSWLAVIVIEFAEFVQNLDVFWAAVANRFHGETRRLIQIERKRAVL